MPSFPRMLVDRSSERVTCHGDEDKDRLRRLERTILQF